MADFKLGMDLVIKADNDDVERLKLRCIAIVTFLVLIIKLRFVGGYSHFFGGGGVGIKPHYPPSPP